MSYVLSFANIEAINSPVFYPVSFMEIHGDSIIPSGGDYIRITTMPNNVTTLGAEFLGLGNYLTISSITDETEIRDNELQIGVNALHPDLHAIFRNPSFIGSKVTIYQGYIDTTSGILVDEPFMKWKGVVDEHSSSLNNVVNDDEPANVTAVVICRSTIKALKMNKSGRFTSLPSFQYFFPNDRSMEFVANLAAWNPEFGKPVSNIEGNFR